MSRGRLWPGFPHVGWGFFGLNFWLPEEGTPECLIGLPKYRTENEEGVGGT